MARFREGTLGPNAVVRKSVGVIGRLEVRRWPFICWRGRPVERCFSNCGKAQTTRAGTILYQLLTGVPPFSGVTIAQTVADEKKELQRQQFAKLHLLLLSVDAGLTDLWEVSLLPANGRGIPRHVIVPGRNSREARATALAKFPGYRVGAARAATN